MWRVCVAHLEGPPPKSATAAGSLKPAYSQASTRYPSDANPYHTGDASQLDGIVLGEMKRRWLVNVVPLEHASRRCLIESIRPRRADWRECACIYAASERKPAAHLRPLLMFLHIQSIPSCNGTATDCVTIAVYNFILAIVIK